MTLEGSARTKQAWDEAALGYEAYFAPRFAPYLGAAIGALIAGQSTLPGGDIWVPCVGPGHELPALARAFADRAILASDLSSEMVKLAQLRAAPFANVLVSCCDANQLRAPEGGVAALLSVFGLQLLPDPSATLASWLGLLKPGGRLVLVYWPRNAEVSGPFHSMRELLRSAGVLDGSWESELLRGVAAHGGRVLSNASLAFELNYESADVLWQALTRLGPLRGLALARGQALIDELGARFVAEFPPGPLSHTPEARLLLVERA